MKQKKNVSLLSFLMTCLFLVMFVSSCKKEEEQKTSSTPAPATTVAQDQQNILTATDNLADNLVDIMNTEGANAGISLISFMGKDDIFGKKGDIKSQIGAKLRNLGYHTKTMLHIKKQKHAAKTTESEPLDFNSKVGTYTWNNITEDWDVEQNNPSDKVIIIFPSDTANPSVNDAKITVSSYSEEMINGEYMPTGLVANLTVDNVEYSSINYTGTFNSEGIPVAINLTLFVKPFTLTIVLNNQTTIISGNVSLTKDGTTIFGVSGSVEFTDASQEELKKVNGTVTVGQLSASADANIAAITAIQDPTIDDLNNNITATISYGGTKVADVVFVEGDADNTVVVVKFKDGTTQTAEEFFADAIEDLEQSLEDAGFAKK